MEKAVAKTVFFLAEILLPLLIDKFGIGYYNSYYVK